MSHLIAATAHVGHSMAKVTKAYQPWIYGTRHGIAQIDIEKATLPALRRACRVVRDIVRNDGVILIVGTQKDVSPAVIAAAARMGSHGFHVTTERWTPGVLSNAPKILQRAIMGSMDDYIAQHKSNAAIGGQTAARDSPFADVNSEPSPSKLASQLLQPDVLIVLNPKNNLHAIREATALNIPTIGIVDTDVDPRIVTYPIPANDESLRALELIVGVLSKAGQEGLKDRKLLTDQWERDQVNHARRDKVKRRMAGEGIEAPREVQEEKARAEIFDD